MNANEAIKAAEKIAPIHRTFVTEVAALDAIEDANVRSVAIAAIRQNHAGHGCTLDLDISTTVANTDSPLALLLQAADKAARER